jgi:hypothetical protein
MVQRIVPTPGRRKGAAAACAAVLFLCSRATGATVVRSPDHKLYAVDSPGQQVGKGQERERLEIFTEQGKQIAVAHVWLVEPDGTARVGIRGCESWGWVDSTRLFCQGTAGPDSGVYLLFDARSGHELQEWIGRGFVWSPDHASIANVGDARDLGTVSENSDSIEVQGKLVFPSEKDSRLHWFRSPLVWSSDSRQIAVADFLPKQGSVHLIVVGVAGGAFERKLGWQETTAGDWPPELDFSVQWTGNQITVTHGAKTETVAIAQ